VVWSRESGSHKQALSVAKLSTIATLPSVRECVSRMDCAGASNVAYAPQILRAVRSLRAQNTAFDSIRSQQETNLALRNLRRAERFAPASVASAVH
jgi:hypothetical protein